MAAILSRPQCVKHTTAISTAMTIVEHGWGAHFMIYFFIAIQIWWKFHSTLIQFLVKWSIWNFAHGMVECAQFCSDMRPYYEFELRWKNLREKDPWLKRIHKIHPYLALTDKLCSIFCEYFVRKLIMLSQHRTVWYSIFPHSSSVWWGHPVGGHLTWHLSKGTWSQDTKLQVGP